MKNLVWAIATSIAFGAGLHPAHATQIQFTGICSDCAGNALAILTVTGFDPSSAFTLTLDNFVSFSYAGTNLTQAFVIDSSNVQSVSGTLGPDYPHAYDVSIQANPPTRSFASSAGGNWAISSGQGPDDVGASSFYSPTAVATPEPGAALEVAGGILLLGVAMSRRWVTIKWNVRRPAIPIALRPHPRVH